MGLSYISLIPHVALSDLENYLKFTGTDPDLKLCFVYLLYAVKVLFANSLNLKGHK